MPYLSSVVLENKKINKIVKIQEKVSIVDDTWNFSEVYKEGCSLL
jgi:hypothetical protein